MKVKQLIKELQNIKESLQDKEIFVYGENGLRTLPEIKYVMNDYSKLDKSEENVECVILI